ncbi:MAG: hypothetical protein LBQ66_06120 [Planctomycetaceae bacterium]|nr:hypothetical protein [Planctomycetaceae bacterium]
MGGRNIKTFPASLGTRASLAPTIRTCCLPYDHQHVPRPVLSRASSVANVDVCSFW